MNRWVEGLGIRSNPDTIAMAARHVSEEGYQGIARVLRSGLHTN